MGKARLQPQLPPSRNWAGMSWGLSCDCLSKQIASLSVPSSRQTGQSSLQLHPQVEESLAFADAVCVVKQALSLEDNGQGIDPSAGAVLAQLMASGISNKMQADEAKRVLDAVLAIALLD